MTEGEEERVERRRRGRSLAPVKAAARPLPRSEPTAARDENHPDRLMCRWPAST
jgi:hypothetical protein